MKNVRFQKVRGGVFVDITCVCGCAFTFYEATFSIGNKRHFIKLSKENNTSLFFRCEKCPLRYEVRSEYDHIHVERVEDTIDPPVGLDKDWTKAFDLSAD